RAGVKVDLNRLNQLSDETPVLVNLKPVGDNYMEDFHAGGGVPAVLKEIRDLLHLDVPTVSGKTLRELIDEPLADQVNRTIVRPRAEPVDPDGGLVAVFGTLAPRGAIVKRAAADKRLLEHEGRAVVFSSLEDLSARIDDPDLDVTADDILVLQNAGPRSAAAMPEAGYLPIPRKLAKAGVKDMVRISDARMSGTAYGAIVLHVAPEAAIGGPLALVKNGDRIKLSVAARKLDLLVDEAELKRRRKALPAPVPVERRGYDRLYDAHVLQADEGVDFDIF
ncbi:MAG: dihydroxy-acid dehydratase, partial [Proteobacteria bacterium]|nr:dihydroxy-acid dehydratase [Pseudomonadota bacterium]